MNELPCYRYTMSLQLIYAETRRLPPSPQKVRRMSGRIEPPRFPASLLPRYPLLPHLVAAVCAPSCELFGLVALFRCGVLALVR